MIAYFPYLPIFMRSNDVYFAFGTIIVRSNFNRLQRKYECLCVLQGMMVLCTVCVEN